VRANVKYPDPAHRCVIRATPALPDFRICGPLHSSSLQVSVAEYAHHNAGQHQRFG
jgi:hypothetical protein